MAQRIPLPESLEHYSVQLTQMVAATSYLPNPKTVQALGRAAFPTARNGVRLERFMVGELAGMYDDNVTPEWALFWSHDLTGTRPRGWNIAHVWPESADPTCYTHPANLGLIPECFASLTDKTGPVARYLRWHAWDVYGWKPASRPKPTKPDGYESLIWRYLAYRGNPIELIETQLLGRNNQRTRILREIMGLTR